MSTICILTPVVIGNWPAITAAAAGAAAVLGLMMKESVKEQIHEHQQTGKVEQHVEVELAESEVLTKELVTDKEIVLTKESLEIRVGRDERGRCKVRVTGKGHTKAELKQIAEQFTQKMTQCFVYNKVASELKNKGFQVINEEVMEDASVRIHVRRWED